MFRSPLREASGNPCTLRTGTTPGSAATRVSRSRKKRTASSFERLVSSGSVTLTLRTPRGSKPGSTSSRREKLRPSKPAPRSRRSASATSETTSTRRRRPRLTKVRPAASRKPPRTAWSAGTRPTASPTAVATASANPSTGSRTATSPKRGRSDGARESSTLTPSAARIAPPAPPEQRQQERLGDEQAHEAPRAGAERRADGKLGVPRLGAGKEQYGEVRADQEEHGTDRREEQEQRRPHRAGQVSRERNGPRRETHPLGIGIGIRGSERSRHRIERCRCLGDAGSRAQPADGTQEMAAPKRHVRRRVPERKEDLARVASAQLVRSDEPRREDANHRAGSAVHRHRGADRRGRTTEQLLPECMGKDRYGMSFALFFRGEGPPEDRIRAQHLEVAGGDVQRA